MELETSINRPVRFGALWPRSITSHSAILLVLSTSVLTLVVLLMHRPFSQIEIGDHANWDYMAQSIVRGQVPYRDVIANKTPASGYLGALAITLGKVVGLRDVLALRMWGVFLTVILSALIYLVTEAYTGNRVVALIAFLIPLMSSRFDDWMVTGTEPKLPMIVFGMLTLWLISKDNPLWAGVCSMLSFLAWQPGLLFSGVAFLMFSRYLTSWRDLRALKVVLGAAIPLAVLIVYFASRGALDDLWFWTITFNEGIYGPENARPLGDTLGHMFNLILRVFKADVVIVLISLAGYAVFAWRQLRARLRRRKNHASPELFGDALLIAPAVYFLFCLIDLQAGPDLIPFFPFLGIFGALFLVLISRAITRRYKKLAAVEVWVPKAALMVALTLTLDRAGQYSFEPMPTLQQQDKQFEAVSNAMAAVDKLYVHGTVELLVLLNRSNLNKYIFLDMGKDEYIPAVKEGGVEAWIKEIESQNPAVVALSRLKHVAHRDVLIRWVETHYRSLELPGYEQISIRKP